jgi:hypothetical protein
MTKVGDTRLGVTAVSCREESLVVFLGKYTLFALFKLTTRNPRDTTTVHLRLIAVYYTI